MRRTSKFLLPFALLALATPLAAQEAQPYKTGGLSLGLYLNGTSVSNEDNDDIESGGGASLRIGYGFPMGLTLFIQGTGANVTTAGNSDDSYVMGHGDLGLRYGFRAFQKINPYVEAAFSGRTFTYATGTQIGDIDLRGAAFTGGAGVEIYLARSVALDLGLLYSVGEFNEGKTTGGSWEDLGSDALSVNTARFNLGLAWHP